MHQFSLDTLATRLAAHLDCTQDVACRQIMRAMAETGQSLAPVHLARRLQMSQENLTAHLARVPDTEFDAQGHIVGWGITLVPTQHHFLLQERPFFTWCAFDTVLFPPLLALEARVRSECSASGQPITFVATCGAGLRIFSRRRVSCHSSCPLSGVIVCAEPFVSNPSFSGRRRPPRAGWHCTPKRSSTRREEAASLGQT